MLYYLIDDKTKRCYGFADQEPGLVDGTTVFSSETLVDNPHDYVLKNGQLVYEPQPAKEVKTTASESDYANAGKMLYGQVTDEEYAKAAKILLEGEA